MHGCSGVFPCARSDTPSPGECRYAGDAANAARSLDKRLSALGLGTPVGGVELASVGLSKAWLARKR